MIMANQILREMALSNQNSKFFSLMADEVTDILNMEQVVICSRHVIKILNHMKILWAFMQLPLLNQMSMLVFAWIQCYA